MSISVSVEEYPALMREALNQLGVALDLEILEINVSESEVEERDPENHVAFTWMARFKMRGMTTEKVAQGKIIWNTGLVDTGIVRSYTARSACTAIGVALRTDTERDYMQRASALWRRYPDWGLGIAVLVQEIIEGAIYTMRSEGRVPQLEEAMSHTLSKFYELTHPLFEHQIWPEFLNRVKEMVNAAEAQVPGNSEPTEAKVGDGHGGAIAPILP